MSALLNILNLLIKKTFNLGINLKEYSPLKELDMQQLINLRSIALNTYIRCIKKLHLERTFLALIIPPPKTVRRYLKLDYTLQTYFNEMKKMKIDYVILRWFEELPNWPSGEDIDIIIKDNQMCKVEKYFTRIPNKNKFDIYTIYKDTWKGLTYYPPAIAKKMIRESVLKNDTYRVLNQRNHYLSLIYHVLFHKGDKSGVPLKYKQYEAENTDHPYLEIINTLGRKIGREPVTTLNDMYKILENEKWLPSLATQRKYSNYNKSIIKIMPEQTTSKKKTLLTLFIIRQWAIDNNQLSAIRDWFDKHKTIFSVIKEIHLTEKEQQLFKMNVRGGVWEKGPYPCSGGGPALLFIVKDLCPTPLGEKEKIKYPYMASKNTLLKNVIRDEINNTLPKNQRANFIHSADDEAEAIEDLKLLNDNKLISGILKTME